MKFISRPRDVVKLPAVFREEGHVPGFLVPEFIAFLKENGVAKARVNKSATRIYAGPDVFFNAQDRLTFFPIVNVYKAQCGEGILMLRVFYAEREAALGYPTFREYAPRPYDSRRRTGPVHPPGEPT